MKLRIDGLQYAKYSEKIFKQMREGRLDAVHITIAYHENFRELVHNLEQWNGYFERFSQLIIKGETAADVIKAKDSGRTAIFFGTQNPSPIEDDIGLVEILQQLGIRFMQLSYNNQSLLATGCYEQHDSGLTNMGKEVVKEMNRVGIVIDMSHSAEQSTLHAIDYSEKPITITHANPQFWQPALRNKSNKVLEALAKNGGILGFSLYPHHLKNKSQCSLEEFSTMVAKTAELMGVEHIAIGSDLCQDQPDSIVEWMRMGRWSKTEQFGEGSKEQRGFPAMPHWYENNASFPNLEQGLLSVGFSEDEINLILGGNWYRFFQMYF